MWPFTKSPAKLELLAVISLTLLVLTSCGGEIRHAQAGIPSSEAGSHLVGPSDSLAIFVLDHPDLSTVVAVRTDGKTSTPLVVDLQAAGKSPTQLARDIEDVLGEYIRMPVVTVTVQGFVGQSAPQIDQKLLPGDVIIPKQKVLAGDVIITPHSGDAIIIPR